MDNHFKKVIVKKLSIIVALIMAIFVLTTVFRAEKSILEEKPEIKEVLEPTKKLKPNFPPVVIKDEHNNIKTYDVPVEIQEPEEPKERLIDIYGLTDEEADEAVRKWKLENNWQE